MVSKYEIKDGASGAVLVSGSRDRAFTFEFLPKDTPVVTVLTEPEAGVATQKALQASIVTRSVAPFEQNLVLTFRPASVKGATGLAHEVWIRDGATSWKAGSVSQPAGNMTSQMGFGSGNRRPFVSDSGKLDVVLRPNPSLAGDTIDVDEVWGGEIVIQGIAVPTTPPTTAPSTAPVAPSGGAASN
jgi:hypothetical protein